MRYFPASVGIAERRLIFVAGGEAPKQPQNAEAAAEGKAKNKPVTNPEGVRRETAQRQTSAQKKMDGIRTRLSTNSLPGGTGRIAALRRIEARRKESALKNRTDAQKATERNRNTNWVDSEQPKKGEQGHFRKIYRGDGQDVWQKEADPAAAAQGAPKSRQATPAVTVESDAFSMAMTLNSNPSVTAEEPLPGMKPRNEAAPPPAQRSPSDTPTATPPPFIPTQEGGAYAPEQKATAQPAAPSAPAEETPAVPAAPETETPDRQPATPKPGPDTTAPAAESAPAWEAATAEPAASDEGAPATAEAEAPAAPDEEEPAAPATTPSEEEGEEEKEGEEEEGTGTDDEMEGTEGEEGTDKQPEAAKPFEKLLQNARPEVREQLQNAMKTLDDPNASGMEKVAAAIIGLIALVQAWLDKSPAQSAAPAGPEKQGANADKGAENGEAQSQAPAGERRAGLQKMLQEGKPFDKLKEEKGKAAQGEKETRTKKINDADQALSTLGTEKKNTEEDLRKAETALAALKPDQQNSADATWLRNRVETLKTAIKGIGENIEKRTAERAKLLTERSDAEQDVDELAKMEKDFTDLKTVSEQAQAKFREKLPTGSPLAAVINGIELRPDESTLSMQVTLSPEAMTALKDQAKLYDIPLDNVKMSERGVVDVQSAGALWNALNTLNAKLPQQEKKAPLKAATA